MTHPLLFTHALDHAQDAVLITDADLDAPGPRIVYANLAFQALTGYTADELLGRSPRLLQGPDTARPVLDALRRCLTARQPFVGTVVNYRKDGTPFELEWHASPVYDQDGRLTHFMSIHRDVTARTRFEQELHHYIQHLLAEQVQQAARQHELETANAHWRVLATTDGLTGLLNHRAFQEALTQMLATVTTVSLMLVDVDHFKTYNDTFGHPRGDLLLRDIAQVLHAARGATDVAARYGGEEFALLLPGQDADHALAVAERVRAEIEAIATTRRRVTVSVGVATVPAAPGMEQVLLDAADSALYAAKAQGRNRIRHHRHLQRPLPEVSGCTDACAPSPAGCLRCASVFNGRQGQRSARQGAALLLGPQDADVAATLRQVLYQAGIVCTTIGPLLVVPDVRRRLGTVGTLFKDRLSPYTRTCVRAAYAPAGADTPEDALAAFVFAEPLGKLLEHVEHEWVRDALAHEWLFSVFHPIVDARTGAIFAHEALLRAQDPHGGQMIGAGAIIEACDVLNLQHQLDQRARQAAIRGAAAHVPAPTRVFINFLPNTIYDPEICLRTTMDTAAAYGVALSRLVFEVVETERIPDLNQLRRILDYYRARGVGTAVDDMGAGFTSLDYLAALRPDYVKLDRALVVEAEHSPARRHHLEHIVQTAHALGTQVIAEGIETDAQLGLCLAADVDYVQGFLFARPASPPAPVDLRQHDWARALHGGVHRTRPPGGRPRIARTLIRRSHLLGERLGVVPVPTGLLCEQVDRAGHVY